jgi:hypothetical protein
MMAALALEIAKSTARTEEKIDFMGVGDGKLL